MSNYRFAMKIQKIQAKKNGRSSTSKSITNRLLIQVNDTDNSNETLSTAIDFKGEDGVDLPQEALHKALPYGIAFKNVDFHQAFDEPLIVNFHHFQDTKKDFLQKLLGKFIEFSFLGLLEGTKLVGVKLDKLLGLEEGLKIGKDTYSQKLGFRELVISPEDFETDQTKTEPVKLKCPENVFHIKFKKPGSSQVIKKKVIGKGSISLEMDLLIKLEKV